MNIEVSRRETERVRESKALRRDPKSLYKKKKKREGLILEPG